MYIFPIENGGFFQAVMLFFRGVKYSHYLEGLGSFLNAQSTQLRCSWDFFRSSKPFDETQDAAAEMDIEWSARETEIYGCLGFWDFRWDLWIS